MFRTKYSPNQRCFSSSFRNSVMHIDTTAGGQTRRKTLPYHRTSVRSPKYPERTRGPNLSEGGQCEDVRDGDSGGGSVSNETGFSTEHANLS